MGEREVRERRQWLLRACAFIALAGVAQLSAALPPGPNDLAYFWASTAVLLFAAACSIIPLLGGFPRWVVLVPVLAYLASVDLLLLSGGTNPAVPSTAGGLSVLVLLPVLAIALYYPRGYSVLVVTAAMIGLTAFGIASHDTVATDIRRLLLWTTVAAAIAVAVHDLRRRLERRVKDMAELARLGRLMNGATQSLTSLRDPADVITEGTQVMASLAGGQYSRAVYLRVRDDVVLQEAVADVRETFKTSFPLRDNPYIVAVLESRQPLATEIERSRVGPSVRALLDESGVTHAALIPIAPNGTMHGIISVASRGAPITEDVFARCRALGNVLELALGNALAHHDLEIQANSDALTGLANRRGLSLYLESDRPPGATAVLVLDIDGLKVVNDTHGHDVGDLILTGVARAASHVLRGGDILARTGGDEFVAIVANADELDARRVADRITAAVDQVRVRGVPAQVSVGYASSIDGDFDRTKCLADDAMYRAKDAGRGPRGLGASAGRAG